MERIVCPVEILIRNGLPREGEELLFSLASDLPGRVLFVDVPECGMPVPDEPDERGLFVETFAGCYPLEVPKLS